LPSEGSSDGGLDRVEEQLESVVVYSPMRKKQGLRRRNTRGRFEKADLQGATPAAMSYIRFGLMILTSTAVMFILMYLNTYAFEHVFFSETRTYMAFVMGATMAVLMLAFMLGMYSNSRINMAIFAGSAIAFGIFVWLVRSQETVEDLAWMRAMIPHHSIAILTSERAEISDPRVRALADAIIEAQRLEITEMKFYVADIEANGEAPPGTPRTTEN
jgi:hypothetical protein